MSILRGVGVKKKIIFQDTVFTGFFSKILILNEPLPGHEQNDCDHLKLNMNIA